MSMSFHYRSQWECTSLDCCCHWYWLAFSRGSSVCRIYKSGCCRTCCSRLIAIPWLGVEEPAYIDRNLETLSELRGFLASIVGFKILLFSAIFQNKCSHSIPLGSLDSKGSQPLCYIARIVRQAGFNVPPVRRIGRQYRRRQMTLW